MNKTKLLARDDRYRTQEQAIIHHNERKECMLSMADIFQLVKNNNIEAIENLRKDLNKWLVTSTRIIYDKENLSAKITHNADSTVTRPIEITLKELSVCRPTYILDLLDSKAGLEYLQALINDKKATKEEIIQFFTKLSGKKKKKIRLWTPTQSQRKSRQVRSVVLCFGYFDWFNVVGDNWYGGNSGLSRGVMK